MVWNGLWIFFGAGLLIFAVYAQMQRNKLPVRFKTFDELNAITDVVLWAQPQIGADDPRRKRIVSLWLYLIAAKIPIGIRISAQDLELLAPFIDRFIAGHGPPSPLPAEYEDLRPTVLHTFKERMQADGLWPPASATTPLGRRVTAPWASPARADRPCRTCIDR